jgi:hypothetical protein
MSAEREPRRGSWYLLTGLLIGLALGLLVAWVIAPVEYVDTAPASLRPDFKDQYRSLIASAYLVTGDLGRAQSRLALLGDVDPQQMLTLQAQNALSAGDPDRSAYALSRLADALKQPPTEASLSPTPELIASMTQAPAGSVTLTPTHRSTSALTPIYSPTPRPTRTPTPTVGAAFVLVSQETVCDSNLPEGLLQIEVKNVAGQPIPGAEISISWQDGEEHIFTGLKPELGNGYADFVMTPDIVYMVQLAFGGQAVTNLSAPSCQADSSDSYRGGIRLLFQQP